MDEPAVYHRANGVGVRVKAEVLLQRLESPTSFKSRHVSVAPADFTVALPASPATTRRGTRVTVNAMTSWNRAEGACQLADLVISAAIDLQTMVLTRANYAVIVGRLDCPTPALVVPAPAYELLNWASSAEDLPYVVRLTSDGVTRLGEIIECAVQRSASQVWEVADGLAAVERAALGVSAPERVVDLWTGLESLTPAPPKSSAIKAVVDWLDGVELTTPGFRAAALAVASSDVRDVLDGRFRLAVLPGIHPSLAARITGPCSTDQERLAVATGCVYAIRNAVVHGSVSSRTTNEIDAIRGAEALTWVLLHARLSERLCGPVPLPAVYRAAVAITI